MDGGVGKAPLGVGVVKSDMSEVPEYRDMAMNLIKSERPLTKTLNAMEEGLRWMIAHHLSAKLPVKDVLEILSIYVEHLPMNPQHSLGQGPLETDPCDPSVFECYAKVLFMAASRTDSVPECVKKGLRDAEMDSSERKALALKLREKFEREMENMTTKQLQATVDGGKGLFHYKMQSSPGTPNPMHGSMKTASEDPMQTADGDASVAPAAKKARIGKRASMAKAFNPDAKDDVAKSSLSPSEQLTVYQALCEIKEWPSSRVFAGVNRTHAEIAKIMSMPAGTVASQRASVLVLAACERSEYVAKLETLWPGLPKVLREMRMEAPGFFVVKRTHLTGLCTPKSNGGFQGLLKYLLDREDVSTVPDTNIRKCFSSLADAIRLKRPFSFTESIKEITVKEKGERSGQFFVVVKGNNV